MKNAFILALALAIAPLHAATPAPLQVYAAGSLTGALAEIAHAYTAQTGIPVHITNGPAGLLRERIEHGEDVDVYISANFAHPQALADEGRSYAPVVFTRNSLCVSARPSLGLTGDNMLEKLLDPKVKIGTSTPHADPGGDYAFAVFARAEALHPGARKVLEAKAQQLVGGPNSPKLPAGANASTYYFDSGKVDVFFGYCSGHSTAREPTLTRVHVPDTLSVPVDYGMTVIRHEKDRERELAGFRFASFAMTPASQKMLVPFGFLPIGLVTSADDKTPVKRGQ
jgi:molybdate transport system substrate-binding protein